MAFIQLKDAKTLNAKVIAWHLIEDVLGWVAVLVVSIALLFSDIQILDPILSILITLYVSYNVIANLKKTLVLFMQAVPESIDISDIDRRLQIIEKVRSTHHTHIWSLDGEHNVLSTHVVVDEDASKEDVRRIKNEVKELIRGLECTHTTVEIEYGDNDCGMSP